MAQDLEIFLLRTLPNLERGFKPGKAYLKKEWILRLSYAPGDIAIKRTQNSESSFEASIIPRSLDSLNRGSLSPLPFPYTMVTVEKIDSGDRESYNRFSSKGFRFTYESEFAPSRLIEKTLGQAQLKTYVNYGRFHSEFAEGRCLRKICVINNNRMVTENYQGKIQYLVLSDFKTESVISFCPRDIILSLSMPREYQTTCALGPHIWKPLTHFWMDESYELRIVKQEIREYLPRTSSNATQTIDQVLRILIAKMIQRREAILELIVNLLCNSAGELAKTDLVLLRMQELKNQLIIFRSIESQNLLKDTILDHLVELNIQQIVPIFEFEVQSLYQKLGPELLEKFRLDFHHKILPLVPRLRDWNSQPYFDPSNQINLMINFITLTFGQDSEDLLPESSMLPKQRAASPTLENSFSNQPFTFQLNWYHAVLFYGLPILRRKHNHPNTLEQVNRSLSSKLKELLSDSEGCFLKKNELLCWKRRARFSEPTRVTLVDLRAMNQLLAETPSEQLSDQPWMHTELVNFEFRSSRWVEMSCGVIFHLQPTNILHMLSIVPSFTHRKFDLLQELTPEQVQQIRVGHEIDIWDNMQDNYHFPLMYSRQHKLLFMALVPNVGSATIFDLGKGVDFVIRLIALRVGFHQKLEQAAFSRFKLPFWHKEVASRCEFGTQSGKQGMTANSFNLPYSPLRWYTSRRNVYCIWLVSPHAHVVYGMKKDCFVQVAAKATYPRLLPEPLFVLPAMSATRIGGMCGLFLGQREWDPQKQAYFVNVYQIKLRRC